MLRFAEELLLLLLKEGGSALEDLERDPLGELGRVYEEPDLPDWRQAAPAVRAYLDTLAGYRKNQLPMEQADLDRLGEQWRFAVEAWGYQPPPTDCPDI